MQRCEKVKTSRYDDPRKLIQGKNLGGFDLTILKVNQIHYKRIEVFTKDLTLNLMLSHVITY